MDHSTAAKIAATALATLTFDEEGQLPMAADGSYTIDAPAEVIEVLKFASRDANGNSEVGDWCRLCRRATDHGGEHSDKQYLEYIS